MAVQIRGRQILNSTITAAKIDLSGDFNFGSGTVEVASPTSANQAANRAFVESYVAGLAWKDACRVATTAAITIGTALNVGDTIDGVTLADGDRVLVKNQTGDDANQNGIYVAGATPARAADMDAGSEFSSAAVFVSEGSVNGDVGFVCTTDGTVVVGTTAITFSQFTGAAQIVAGDGLAKSGNTLSVNVDDSSIELNSDALRVKASGITNAMLAGSIANSKLSNSTISGVALGSNLNSLSLASNSGLSMSSYNGSAAVGDLKMHVSALAAGTAQMIDEIAIDRGGTTQRESLQDIFALAAGSASATSLAASSGVLSVQVDDSAIARDGSGNLTVKALGIGSGELAADSVIAAKIAADAVTAAKIAADAVTAAKIAADAVTSAKIAADAVTQAKIADDAVGADQLAANAVLISNLGYQGYFEKVATSNATTSTIDLARAIDVDLAQSFAVAVNGLLMEYKASPDAQDNYKIDNTGAGSVGRITFGANLSNGDVVSIRYIA